MLRACRDECFYHFYYLRSSQQRQQQESAESADDLRLNEEGVKICQEGVKLDPKHVFANAFKQTGLLIYVILSTVLVDIE